jgi:hypothetical protein
MKGISGFFEKKMEFDFSKMDIYFCPILKSENGPY